MGLGLGLGPHHRGAREDHRVDQDEGREEQREDDGHPPRDIGEEGLGARFIGEERPDDEHAEGEKAKGAPDGRGDGGAPARGPVPPLLH